MLGHAAGGAGVERLPQSMMRRAMDGRGHWGWRTSLKLTADGFIEVVETLSERPYTLSAAPSDEPTTRGYMVVGSVWYGEKTPFYLLFPQDRAWQLVARDGRQLDESQLKTYLLE